MPKKGRSRKKGKSVNKGKDNPVIDMGGSTVESAGVVDIGSSTVESGVDSGGYTQSFDDRLDVYGELVNPVLEVTTCRDALLLKKPDKGKSVNKSKENGDGTLVFYQVNPVLKVPTYRDALLLERPKKGKSVNKSKENLESYYLAIGNDGLVKRCDYLESTVEDIGGSTVESGVDIGGGSKVESAGVDSSEDDIPDIRVKTFVKYGIDNIRAFYRKYVHRRKVGCRRARASDDNMPEPGERYKITNSLRNSRSNAKGDEYSHEWVVKRLLSRHEDWPPLGGKRLFSCFHTFNEIVVLSVHLSSSSSSSPLMSWTELLMFKFDDWEVGQYPVNCVSHRSRIMLCGRFSWNPSVDAPSSARGLSKLPDLPLNSRPLLMVELGGNLLVLFFDKKRNEYSLNVLGSHNKVWLKLPQPPYLGLWRRHNGPLICPAVVGTKLLLFVQAIWDVSKQGPYWDSLDRRVFSFDPAASKGREWRQLPAPSFCFNLHPKMCNQAAALVLNESNMNIMFLFDCVNYRIGVHTLELDDDIMSSKMEVVKLIGYFQLPRSSEFTLPRRGQFVHIGARKVCFIGADVCVPSEDDACLVVIPFEFDIDITQENAKFFILKFMAPRISQTYPINHYETGSFLL